MEARNRRVEIALDYNELRDIAAAEGLPLSHVLRRFREAGATSVALQEDTIGSLTDAGRITLVKGERAGATFQIDAALFDRVNQAIGFKTPWSARTQEVEQSTTRRTSSSSRRRRRRQQSPPPPPPPRLLVLGQPFSIARSLGVGLEPGAVQDVKNAGLGIVGRIGNWDGASPASIAWALAQLSRQGVSTVIFSGDETLGHKGRIAADPKNPDQPSTESGLRQANLYYGNVEFVKQKGDALLMKAAADRTVRVHTISGAEMLTADLPGNIQRFQLAARERNIRLLFVRLFMDEPDLLATNVEYVEKLGKGLERGNLERGFAHGYAPLSPPAWLRFLMALGLASGWLLLVDSITLFLAGRAGALTLLIGAAGALLLFVLPLLPGGAIGVKLAAFAAACIFPSLALVSSDLLRPAPPGESPLLVALVRFAKASGITALGIALVVGLLSDRLFLIKADSFIGVKATRFAPLLVAALVYGLSLRATERRPWPQALGEAGRRIGAVAAQPILVWQVLIGLAALIALAIVLMRTGNEPGVGVSAMELKVRALLDRFFGVRPRFQEFLIGHPAMILALALSAHGAARYPPPPAFRLLVTGLLLVGGIGQVSLLNTFSHTHTPLVVCLWRAVLGLIIGVIIGALAYWVLDRLLLSPYRRRSAAIDSAPPPAVPDDADSAAAAA